MNGIGLQWSYYPPTTAHPQHQKAIMGPMMIDNHNGQDSLTERVAFLRSLPLFAGLNSEELRFLAGEAQTRTYAAGVIIFHAGEPGHTCHIITKGKVRVYVIGEDGHELSVSIFGPGEIVGEMALFEDLPRSASVETIEPTTTLELHQNVLLHGLERSPTLARSLLRALSARLRSMTEEAEGLASLTVADRLIARLRRLAEWSGRPAPDGVRITLPMTQQELAALVGTSRESVNRALGTLRRQGKVRLDNGWIVLLDA
ncbi:MAG: Crp/Fnr family transcriptional regulator [Anaerolineae bacterium]